MHVLCVSGGKQLLTNDGGIIVIVIVRGETVYKNVTLIS